MPILIFVEVLCFKKIIVKNIHKNKELFTVFQPLEIMDELIGGWIGDQGWINGWMNELITHVSSWWWPKGSLPSPNFNIWWYIIVLNFDQCQQLLNSSVISHGT